MGFRHFADHNSKYIDVTREKVLAKAISYKLQLYIYNLYI